MNVRDTLKQLGDLAVGEVRFCVGIHWRSVTGSRVPPGISSPNCLIVTRDDAKHDRGRSRKRE